MPELTVFVPTRQRPDNLLDFGGEFERHLTSDTRLVFIVDEDDEFRERYIAVNDDRFNIFIAPPTRRGMVGALNAAFRAYLSTGRLGYAVGFMGDDHRPRTPGWDTKYLAELHNMGSGFVYGDDLLQGEAMPTQVAFTTDIAMTLGYMCPPEFDHLCVDLVWKDWGLAINRIKYLPDVVIEHMHPMAGKARMDKAYRAVNSNLIARHDSQAYQNYKSGDFYRDVEKLKRLTGEGLN